MNRRAEENQQHTLPFGQLTIEKECGLASECVLACHGGPVRCDLAARGLILGELVGPRHLKARVITMTGDGLGSRREAQENDEGEIEVSA